MLVEDVINLARHSELQNVAVQDDIPAIMAFINLGVIELYKRFVLSRVEVQIPLVEGQTSYTLPTNFMYPTSAYRMVKRGNELVQESIAINDTTQGGCSIYFPVYNQVQIPKDIEGDEITIVYVDKPRTYTMNHLLMEIEIPEVLIDCLLHFVSYKAHLGIRGEAQSESTSHYQRFERSVRKAKELGICVSTDSLKDVDRIGLRGFV